MSNIVSFEDFHVKRVEKILKDNPGQSVCDIKLTLDKTEEQYPFHVVVTAKSYSDSHSITMDLSLKKLKELQSGITKLINEYTIDKKV